MAGNRQGALSGSHASHRTACGVDGPSDFDPEKGDLDIHVVPNGPGVREAVEEMVRDFPLDGVGL